MLLAFAQAVAVATGAAEAEVEVAARASAADLRPIVVTASRVEDLPGSTIRIEQSEIERRNSSSLLDSLSDIAGVRAFSTGGPAGRSFLSIRGGEPNFTLVLLEGMRLNDPTNSRGGGFDFFLLDPWLVEAVEVSRGAGSPVHGSEALSGVVNIALRRPGPGETQALARISAGTEGERGVGASLGHGYGEGSLLLGASWHESDDLSRGSLLERRQAVAQFRHDTGWAEMAATALHGEAERAAYPEDSGGPLFAASDALERGTAELNALGLSLRGGGGGALRPGLSVSYVRQSDVADTPAIADGVFPGTPAITADTRISRIEAVADVVIETGPLRAGAGAAWLEEDGRSRGTIDFGFPLPPDFQLDRTTHSAFAEARLKAGGGVSFDAAARYDHVSGAGERWTGRLGAAWQPSPASPTFFARVAQGYKLPSFYALGHPLIGNPALRSERSRNLEAGVEWRSDRGSLRAAVFDNRFRHLIDFDPQTFTLVNRDRVAATGAEVEGRWQLTSALGFAGSLTWVDLDSPTPLRGRPAWHGSLRAHWAATDDLEVNARLGANTRLHDSSVPTGPVLAGGHVEADMGLRYRLSSRFALAATLRNLTGSRHQDAVGFRAAGPELRASLEIGLF